MNDYLMRLAQSLKQAPTDLGQIDKTLLNSGAFNARQKARLLEEVRKRYFSMGKMNPIERFGHATEAAMAQVDEPL